MHNERPLRLAHAVGVCRRSRRSNLTCVYTADISESMVLAFVT